MYFHREKGKQTLDLRGNLILSKNVNLITSRVKSAAPTHVENAKYVVLNGKKSLNASGLPHVRP